MAPTNSNSNTERDEDDIVVVLTGGPAEEAGGDGGRCHGQEKEENPNINLKEINDLGQGNKPTLSHSSKRKDHPSSSKEGDVPNKFLWRGGRRIRSTLLMIHNSSSERRSVL